MKTIRVGRVNVTIELNTAGKHGQLSKYDYVASDDEGRILSQHIGCIIKEENLEKGMWFKYIIKFAERYNILMDAYDMAFHNLMCYSTSYAMDTPKPGYEDKWKEMDDKITVLNEWMDEITNNGYFGRGRK